MTGSMNWRQLFQLEGPKLRRFLRRYEPAISAEDVCQESFAALAAAEPSSVISPKAYLYQAARNVAANALKRQRRSPVVAACNHDVFERPSGAPSPEDALIAAERAAQVRRAIEGLTERQRASLLLFKLHGLSHREIGDQLGISPRTVEHHIAAAIAHCHKVLSAAAHED